MFIVPTKPHPAAQEIMTQFRKQFGTVPPHFELFAALNPKRFEMFVQEIVYLAAHQNIHPDMFAFIRLHIAAKEGFEYCQNFNTRLLLAKGYSKDVVQNIRADILNIPFDDRHKSLADKALKAVYEPESFSANDLDELLDAGWSNADIYDAIDHAVFLFKYARIIKAYSTI